MRRDYCNFCSIKIDYEYYDTESRIIKLLRIRALFGVIKMRFDTGSLVPGIKGLVGNAGNTTIDGSFKIDDGDIKITVCESCFDLYDSYSLGTGSTSHLNDAQKKVFLKYGLIDPRVAVAKANLDNTWQDSEYPTLTLEDLNFRRKNLAQETPFGCLFILIIIFGFMIFQEHLLLGILGMISVFYWARKADRGWEDINHPIYSNSTSSSSSSALDDNKITTRAEKSSKTKRKKLTTKNVLYYLFGAYGICLGIYTIVKFIY
ncbi:hypothetical protein N9K05_00645 [Woeseiaceae bacterium]|nr:hypothetical protein [Woeseiaceae bacterium]